MLNNKEDIKSWLDSMEIKNYTINDDLTVDGNDNVKLSSKELENLPVQFGIVKGFFDCSFNQLTSLKGCPEVVDGFFNCSNNLITSLKYLPLSINGSLFLDNNKLTSLEHCPKEILGDFECHHNDIYTYEYLPDFIKGNFKHDGSYELNIYENQPLIEIKAVLLYKKLQKNINKEKGKSKIKKI